jgi:hypothetical protein
MTQAKARDLMSRSCVGGKVNLNTAPRGSFASAHNRPPWASMMDLQIDKPIPTPLALVV